MVQETSKGIRYPEPTDNTQIWTHIQNCASDVDGLLIPAATVTTLTSAIGAWTSYTPSWSTSTGNATPALGNATIDAKYVQIGQTVLGRIDITFGSTTNFGTSPTTNDNWQFGVPVPSADSSVSLGEIEGARSGGQRFIGRLHLISSTQMAVEISSGRPDSVAITNTGTADSLSPWTWANGDWLKGTYHYEAA